MQTFSGAERCNTKASEWHRNHDRLGTISHPHVASDACRAVLDSLVRSSEVAPHQFSKSQRDGVGDF